VRSFTLVGAGRLGTVLAAALARRGWTPELIVDTDARAARDARRAIGAGRATVSVRASSRLGDVVLIAVPDAEIARAAAGLAASGVRWERRTVLHTSGLQPARLLAPLARHGALVASLHPVQSFARKDAPASVFSGITWGVEGDPAAVATCVRIVRALRGRVLLLSEQDKPLYHAACSLASNALVALEATAAGALRAIGIGGPEAEAMLFPLLQGTLQNVKNLGLEKALTGPVLRGDVDTIRGHLEALWGDPEAREVYLVLGRRALGLAAKRGLPAGRVRALKRLLGGG
jgi:predicted short-subunit dehydrogenase-like oxidoreductase (DUF2520 family)